MEKNKGYIQVYTGNGKGKTTAALGLCLRAIGAKKFVYIAQFMKSGNYSEIIALKKFSNQITVEQFGLGKFITKKPTIEEIKSAKKGISSVLKNISSGEYDLIVMDEANIAITYGLLNVDEIIQIIEHKAESTELIITGRNADPRILEIADLVTEMIEIKHYFNKGIKARLGIEK